MPDSPRAAHLPSKQIWSMVSGLKWVAPGAVPAADNSWRPRADEVFVAMQRAWGQSSDPNIMPFYPQGCMNVGLDPSTGRFKAKVKYHGFRYDEYECDVDAISCRTEFRVLQRLLLVVQAAAPGMYDGWAARVSWP